MKRLILLFVGFILLATACTPGTGETTIETTSTPFSHPTPQATAAVIAVQEQWFSEHFDEGMPANWVASPGWENGTSSVLTGQPEQTFRVPAEWTDLVIHARLRRGPEGWSSIGFRDKGDNYYQLSFNQGGFILGRHSSGEYRGQQLAQRQMAIDANWHDLVIRVAGGRVAITWDGQIVIDFTDPDPLASGDIFVQNWDDSLYELDILEVSPPEGVAANSGGPGNSTSGGDSTSPGGGQPTSAGGGGPVIPPADTPTPPGSNPPGGGGSYVADLALTGGWLDGRGNLWVTIANNGPAAYTGVIDIICTIWYAGSPDFGMADTGSQSVVLEPGLSSDVQTACTLDESQGAYIGSNIATTLFSFDPDPTNNGLNIIP